MGRRFALLIPACVALLLVSVFVLPASHDLHELLHKARQFHLSNMAELFNTLLVIFGLFCLALPSNSTKPSLSDPLDLQRFGGKQQILADDYVKGSIWPKPQGQTQTGVKFSLLPNSFSFSIKGKTSDVLTAAVKRYMNLTFPDFAVTKKDDKLAEITGLEINVVDDYKPMTLESDESCLSNCDPLNGYDNGWFPEELKVTNYVKGSVFPKPQYQSPKKVKFSLIPGQFKFRITGKESDVLEKAVDRYLKLTFPDHKVKRRDKRKLQITSLRITAMKDYKAQTLQSDESYTLTISAPQSTLYAYEVWGALRGLETFSQVVYQDENDLYYAEENKIVDYPRFHHRGFMIDTSRHYLKPSIILKFLDAMSYGKFNVFHWHVVDDQSFPFVSKTFPTLSGQGSYNNKTHIYSEDVVKNVIEYARLRGIRVIPEFDTPGHTFSWRSIENLLTKCCDKQGKPNGGLGPIDPTIDSNYDFLKQFFGEIAARYPDTYLHLGGDEVSFDCWKSNPNITKWMQAHGMGSNYSLLEQYYEQKLLNIIGGLKKQYIIWQEVVDNNVKVLPDTVVNVWKGGWPDELAKVTGLGLKTILSSCWYLNYISYGLDWNKYYQCEPTNFSGSEAQKELIMGGTGCMWGEWVDGTNILPRTWPRALAVAERLWSSKTTTDLADATNRIWEHRCRYLRRGIPAENAVQSKYCRHEWPVDEK